MGISFFLIGSYLFHGTGMPGALSEPAAGGILLICSLLVMTFSLLLMVKVLNSLIKGPMARMVRKAVSADFPGCFKYFTGYICCPLRGRWRYCSLPEQLRVHVHPHSTCRNRSDHC